MKNYRTTFLLLALYLLFGAFLVNSCSDEKSNSENLKTENDNGKIRNLVDIPDEQKDKLNIKTIKASSAETDFRISAPGFVYPEPNNFYIISTPVQGRVISLVKHEGELVRKGDLLLEIESSQFGSLVADYLQANAAVKFEKDQYERIKLLVEKKISSDRELLVAEANYIKAKTNVDAVYSRLKSVGISDEVIEEFSRSKNINPVLKIYSPIDGKVDQHLIEMGQSVNEYEKLATVINTKKVLVKGYVDPGDGSYMKSGDKVVISLKNQPNRSIESKIETISPGLDETNKSLVVNIVVMTEENWPRIGENLRVEILTRTRNMGIVVPMDAVVFDGDNSIVFVKQSESKYEKRVVKLKTLNAENALVENGLSEGEEVATTELFTLKALSRFEQFSEE